MTTYRITSQAGVDHGTWKGATPAHALAAMHRKAGYAVTVRGGELVFPDAATRQLCGDVDDWSVKPIPTRGPRRAGAVLLALTTEEREELRAAAARDDRPLAAWIRHVALEAARAPRARR